MALPNQSVITDILLGRQGSYSQSRDVILHTLYDTRYFGATFSDYTFFVQPIGSAWRTGSKTLNETNMNSAGSLPNGQSFIVKRIGLSLISALEASDANGADIVQAFTNIVQSSVFELRIAGREYDFQAHGSEFLPNVFVNTDLAATQSTNVTRVGDVIASGWVPLRDTPIVIGELVNFSVHQEVNNPDTAVQTILNANSTLLNGEYCTMKVSLQGVLTRAK